MSEVDEMCDPVDAMVFTGDALLKQENLDNFQEYLARWGRQIPRFQKQIDEMKEEAERG